jgi:YD repeat-containing protein
VADGASLTYADENGQQHAFNYDFAVFAKDVAR